MLAGWMTIEARLVSAFLIVLVFAAGTLPAHRTQALPVAVVAAPTERAHPVVRLEPILTQKATPASEPEAEPTGELTLLNQDRARAGYRR